MTTNAISANHYSNGYNGNNNNNNNITENDHIGCEVDTSEDLLFLSNGMLKVHLSALQWRLLV